MKYAILNDTHCGVRNSSDIFIGAQEQFYSQVFFPYLVENGIKHILHLGDYFDNRRMINTKALQANKEHFLDRLVELDIQMHIVPGNHDCYYKNTIFPNSVDLLLGDHPNVVVYNDPIVIDNILLVPWICADNYDSVMCTVKKHANKNMVCMGHFEFNGFEMHQGYKMTHGMDAAPFDAFGTVLSGHYHTKSKRKNITYLGSQMQFTWHDAADDKFFHVWDTSDDSLTSVYNPNKLYLKIDYNDDLIDYSKFEITDCDHKHIKIQVVQRNDPAMFDMLVASITDRATYHDLKIIEQNETFSSEEMEDVELDDTRTLIKRCIDQAPTSLDKDRITNKMFEYMRIAMTETE